MARVLASALAAVIAVTLCASPAAAQQTVTPSDIQRLQDNILQATTDISQLRSRDATQANQLQGELDDLRDETIYLKVKIGRAHV